MRLPWLATSENHSLYPYLLTILTLLKTAAPAVYRNYAFDGGNARKVVEYLETKTGFDNIILETSLVAAKVKSRHEEPEEIQQYKILAEDHTVKQKERDRAQEFLKMYQAGYQYREKPSLAYLVNKLELAAQFK